VALILSLPKPALAQNRKQQLDELRRDIARLQQQIAEQEKSESSTVEFLRTLEEQIDLTHRLISQLRKQEDEKRKKIEVMERTLVRNEDELKRLKEMAAQRAVIFYKYGRLQDLEILLTARSLNQVLLWAKYHQRLVDNDRRILNGIVKKQEQNSLQKSQLATELTEHQKKLREKQEEEARLKKRRQQRQELLKKLRNDKSFYQAQLAETQRAVARIIQLISSAEAVQRSSSPVLDTGEFARLRKVMLWPVEGQISSHYGTYRHPVLNTVTKNLGIDITAPAGTPVRSVARGKVTAITWQRGYGNVIIISHTDGYYTVYTHLAEIAVSTNEEVAAEQIIGTLGETGSLQESKLHFQVWNRTEALDPEEWLRP
jgi:septal ring factor EnvC (AmiA/AmiB activator)